MLTVPLSNARETDARLERSLDLNEDAHAKIPSMYTAAVV